MTTLQAEETRRFTRAELAAMREGGVIGPAESIELREGRMTVDGRLRPIMPDEAILLVETGIVEERVELIDGELWIVSPQSEAHMLVIGRLTRVLVNAYHEPAERSDPKARCACPGRASRSPTSRSPGRGRRCAARVPRT